MEKPRTSSLNRASLEGTVRMPQASMGIRLRTAEHCIASADPKAAVAELIQPIPLDEALAERTKKANAQHAHHGIGREVTSEEVRRIQVAGNFQTLKLIAESVGVYIPPRQMLTFDTDGTWADPELTSYVNDIQNRLTPESVASLRKVLGVAVQTFSETSTKAKLAERKDAYVGWGTMKPAEKQDAQQTSTGLAEEVRSAVVDALFEARGSAATSEEREMFTRVINETKNKFSV